MTEVLHTLSVLVPIPSESVLHLDAVVFLGVARRLELSPCNTLMQTESCRQYMLLPQSRGQVKVLRDMCGVRHLTAGGGYQQRSRSQPVDGYKRGYGTRMVL